MARACEVVLKERERAFIDAAEGFPREVIERLMRGLPVEGEGSERVRLLRQAWSHYHECL